MHLRCVVNSHLRPSFSFRKERTTGETSRTVHEVCRSKEKPWSLVVTQCDVRSECSFNKIHCRLAAPVSYRVSQNQVGCVLCGGSPLPESESSSVNLFVSLFFSYISFPRISRNTRRVAVAVLGSYSRRVSWEW